MKKIKEAKTEAILILSGLLNIKKPFKIPKSFKSFKTHINFTDSGMDATAFLENFFSPQFLANALPLNDKNIFYKGVNSYTKTINSPYTFQHIGISHTVKIVYLDLFTFSNDTMIYAIKFDLSNLPLEIIPIFNKKIRGFDIEKNSVLADLFFMLNNCSKVSKSNISNTSDYFHLVVNGNILKSYLMLSENFEYTEDYGRKELLLDLATVSKIGTASKKSNTKDQFAPNYADQLLNENLISIYKNWTAVTIYDSFVYIQEKDERGLNVFQWEYLYFRFIYINSFFVKNYLSEINTEFRKEKYNKQLTDTFIQFDKTYNLQKISFNFLPNLIYKNLNKGFQIEKEMEQLHLAIENENIKNERQENQRLNNVLLVITLFTLISVLKDWFDWLADYIRFEGIILYSITLSPFVIILIIIVIYMLKHREKSI